MYERQSDVLCTSRAPLNGFQLAQHFHISNGNPSFSFRCNTKCDMMWLSLSRCWLVTVIRYILHYVINWKCHNDRVLDATAIHLNARICGYFIKCFDTKYNIIKYQLIPRKRIPFDGAMVLCRPTECTTKWPIEIDVVCFGRTQLITVIIAFNYFNTKAI